MGQLPDNALEEQLEVIRRFSKEFSGRGPRRTTIPQDRSAAISPPRGPASLGTAIRGPGRRRDASMGSPAVSGTAPGPAATTQPGPATAIRNRPVAPPTDVPVTSIWRLPPSQRPPRAARAGPPHWAIPLAASRHPVKRKKPPAVVLPSRPPRGQRRIEAEPRDPGDLVTLRFRLSWSVPAVLGILPLSWAS